MLCESGVVLVLCVLLTGMNEVTAHGRLKDPPGRSSLWRSPDVCHEIRHARNYDDMQLNCGGRTKQWSAPIETPRGRCGVCGDAADGEQDNQPGGRYFSGIISRCYTAQTNAMWIHVLVEITANHKGYMEFKMCQKDNMTAPVTQDCLDQNLLGIRKMGSRTVETQIWIQQEWTTLDVELNIPAGFQCRDCVLQWTYFTGNSEGSCRFDTRTRRYDCRQEFGGPEMFVNCADVAILPDCSALGRPLGRNRKCFKPRLNDGIVVITDDAIIETTPNPVTTTSPAPLCTEDSVQCVAASEFWSTIPGIEDWCLKNISVQDCAIILDPARKYHPLICLCSFTSS